MKRYKFDAYVSVKRKVSITVDADNEQEANEIVDGILHDDAEDYFETGETISIETDITMYDIIEED